MNRDGTKDGYDIDLIKLISKTVKIPVIASGGLASLRDIERILQRDCAKLAGAITGRALYDGRLDPVEALTLIRQAQSKSEVHNA